MASELSSLVSSVFSRSFKSRVSSALVQALVQDLACFSRDASPLLSSWGLRLRGCAEALLDKDSTQPPPPALLKSDLATVVHALVTSRLDYCNALYVGLPLKTARKLQLVQRAAAMLLTGAGRREHTSPLLFQLHWLPICYRAQFKVLVLSYKALNSSGPKYLSDRISAYDPTRTLRSSGEALLSIPPASQARLAGTRERAFSVVAPRLWNTLPVDIRQAPSLMSFRKSLKTWLFEKAFN
ncbi:uncharacterized protein [Anolis sagrei]|uniref:uncharacterized protein n=1 Tax=Anolis sagrei TaxID=38937 RepID=UPI003521EA3D